MRDFERDRPGLGLAVWSEDGYPHEREDNGFCGNCGASKNEYHYKLKPREDDR